ncbi:asparagine synthase (glutamine-hydrolyzing) [Chryseobacterium sp. 6424]|uniref:asparagine synthase (glutamine-hydrolyzing) n=1 Tax=Chryseobacterium sp. 6424 TaxID=2039166 RepID=UPI000EFC46F2|nr:asparagine synthase (glutamine-hydrolyzing) [Chryseobacterium sp. 6424]AYO56926.1 asparagine synthase (glutamine-hydrolyzing) [Chryseobacterium sp. 6424]
MCGINGIIKNNTAEEQILTALELMNRCIIHRGPDEDGFYAEENLGMAMRRLSIIDLSTGKQPVTSDQGNLVIVFNGEIYNYRQHRDTLMSEGVQFKTTSDTEVILKLYEKYGTEAFGMLDGMFAFSILDKKKNKLYIARDFFGEKPLYYQKSEDGLIWASELKSIIKVLPQKPPISPEGLNLYFRLTYIPAPYTIYEGIKKLEANHFMEVEPSSGNITLHEIKRQNEFENRPHGTYQDETRFTHDLVMESVASRSVADVPLGTFLSGGVDSSIVSLALAKQTEAKINTFSVGFEKKSFDETDKSQTVAKLIGSNHHEFILKPGDLQEQLHEILLNFDEPFADSSALPTYLVSEKTRQHVTVALTGDGGDEIFGGYNKYYVGKLNSRYTAVVPRSLHKSMQNFGNTLLATRDDRRGKRFQLRKLLNAVNYEGDFYYNMISLAFTQDEKRELLQQNLLTADSFAHYRSRVSGCSTLTDFRNIDRYLSLEGDMLVKVDRTSMLASLESRAPFLNKKLWDYTSTLPENFLINGWNKKRILKDAFRHYFPENFLDKSKKGFGVPVGDWLRGHLANELKRYSSAEILVPQNIFNARYIQKLVGDHLSGKADNTFRIWTFYCFQKWYQNIYKQ